MHDSAPLLIAFVVDSTLRRVLERAMQRRGTLVRADTPGEFVEHLASFASNGIFIDLSEPRSDIEALVPAAVAHCPRLPLLLYTPLDPKRAGDVLRIAQCFPTSLILQGYDDVARGVVRFLRDDMGVVAATAIVRELAEGMGGDAEWLMSYCLARAERALTVVEAAAALGVSERTLARRVRLACDMTPQEFLTRSRLLLAAGMLHMTRLSVGEVAARTGFADAPSLAHSIVRHFGWRCGELREAGRFLQLLSSLQERYPRWFTLPG